MDTKDLLKGMFHFLFCCMSQEEQEGVYTAVAGNNRRTVYEAQQNLQREKDGYRCSICGRFYPYIGLEYQDDQVDLKKYAKIKGTLRKGKKAAMIFGGDFYYAKNKKTLLKFEADATGAFRETDVIPVMADVGYGAVSHDGKYLLTVTLKKTIEIIDTRTKERIARKLRTPWQKFIFTKDNRVLYFLEDNIRLWDFHKNTDSVVWTAPKEWKQGEDPSRRVNIVCKNLFYNGREKAYFFVLSGLDATYVVLVKNMEVDRIVQLPGVRVFYDLTFEEALNRYTFPMGDRVVLYDSDFQVVESFVPPCIARNHDGGGIFPVSQHKDRCPGCVLLSPNGKWLLLYYYEAVVLMRHEDLSIKLCLSSHTGTRVTQVGFIDGNHFWYTRGDTTYIQEIEE